MSKKEEVVLETGEKIESIGPWRIAWRKFCQNKVAVAGLVIFVLIVISVIVVPMVLGYSIEDLDLTNANQAPNAEHLLGTDDQGRDCLYGWPYFYRGWTNCGIDHSSFRLCYRWNFRLLWWKSR